MVNAGKGTFHGKNDCCPPIKKTLSGKLKTCSNTRNSSIKFSDKTMVGSNRSDPHGQSMYNSVLIRCVESERERVCVLNEGVRRWDDKV